MLNLSGYFGDSFDIGNLTITITKVAEKKVQLEIVNKKRENWSSMVQVSEGEETSISANVRIKIIKIIGRQFRLGIKAPMSIQVLRKKIIED